MSRKHPDTLSSLRLNATEGVIASAKRNNSAHCVVAQAIRSLGEDFSSVSVTAESASFNYKGVRYQYAIPAAVAARVIDFDKGKAVKPFVCLLQNPFTRPVLKNPNLGGKGTPKRKRKGRTQPECVRACVRRYHGLKVIEKSA